MLKHLQALAQICTAGVTSAESVVHACSVIAEALGAGDAYVIRGGDPAFVRLGCECDPAGYEIKQKGYWLIWRSLAENVNIVAGTFDCADRLVSPGRPLAPNEPATHFATILPSAESNSDLLIVRGPWPQGLAEDAVQFVDSARPILAHLVGNVVDADRRRRQREQLDALANVADAFNRAHDTDNVLTDIATAIAQASGFEWVTMMIYDDACTRVVGRAINTARHSETRTASTWLKPNSLSDDTGILRVGTVLARTNAVIRIPNVLVEGLEDREDLEVMRDDIPGLQRYWTRAHILSVAIVPIVAKGKALGYVSFNSTTSHDFGDTEIEFLRALTAQVATAITGIRLFRDLESSRNEVIRSEERFRSLVQNASDLITVIDEDMTIHYQSPAIEGLLGYRAESMPGRRFVDIVHPDDAFSAWSALHETMTMPGAQGSAEVRMQHADGTWRHVEVIISDQRATPAIDGLVVNTRDVSERKSLEDELRDQALRDPLTHLANRARFATVLERALIRARHRETRVAVLFMDLDNFKGINDSLGHGAGDALLIEVATRMRATVRPLDLVARLGGDEFAVLVEDVACSEDAGAIGGRVLATFDTPFALGDREVTVRASLGIALSEHGAVGDDAPGLLRDADVAMYAAKSEGKSCWRIFDPAMQSPMIERLELLTGLQRAVEQHELILHYQPIYDLRSNRLHGVEALVRWDHPQRGLVPPGVFIPLAEECGAIISLGRWVLGEACRQAARWHAEYPCESEWAISINVSPRQLLHPAFIDDVRGALAESGIEPGRLILEVTESALMQDVQLAANRLLMLKEIGVQLAIDDFGTGYSSLSYLRDFPFDLLKIDRAFIADLGVEERGKELAAAIIELGRTLNLELVAEGIEHTDQLSRLKLLGCTFGQGFHLAKPMDALAIQALLSRGAAFTELRQAA